MTVVEETEEGRDEQPQPAPHHTGEKVGGPQYGHMDADELPLRHSLLTLRGRWDAVVFENVAYRLVTDGIAQIG